MTGVERRLWAALPTLAALSLCLIATGWWLWTYDKD